LGTLGQRNSGPEQRTARLSATSKSGKKRGSQIGPGEGLLQHRIARPPRINASCAVSACKNEGDTALAQVFDKLADALTRNIDIENGGIDAVSVKSLQRLRYAAGRERNLAAHFNEIFFDQHCNEGFILDNKNLQAIERIGIGAHVSSFCEHL